ncbi:MAG TPA: hypothetical protein VMD91_03480 [Candidatus Sulfotelmatobacter sp.]|nr:hypothetical protein [Candidatus Sulfotelmatobacter sp.]
MRRPVAALLLALAMPAVAGAQVPIGPRVPQPQPGTNSTATLLFNAMMSIARAAATNPQAASAATLNYSVALQRYGSGDLNGAQASAIRAMIQANTPQTTAIPTIAPLVPNEHPRVDTYPANSMAQIDADAMVAQARGAVAACTAKRSPDTRRANDLLANAQKEDLAGLWLNAKMDAKAAIDLCATSARS